MKFNIFGIYKAPHTGAGDFTTNFKNILATYKHSIHFGDLNLNLLDENDRAVGQYMDTVRSKGFLFLNKCHIDHCTRLSTESSTVIDHIITDLLTNTYSIALHDTPISDHRHDTSTQQ